MFLLTKAKECIIRFFFEQEGSYDASLTVIHPTHPIKQFNTSPSSGKVYSYIEYFQSGKNDFDKLIKPYIPSNFRNKKVLDFGCGDGRLAPNFSKVNYIGVDLNEQLLTLAKQHHPGYKFINRDELKALATNSQDMVFALASLIHISSFTELDTVMEEIHRLLDKDGLALLSFRVVPRKAKGVVINYFNFFDKLSLVIVKRSFLFYPIIVQYNFFYGISPKKSELEKVFEKYHFKILQIFDKGKYRWAHVVKQ